MFSVNAGIEYLDSLVSCELAMMMAIKYKEPVDSAVKRCAAIVSARCTNEKNKQVFSRLSNDNLPAVTIYQFRTMLDEELSKN